jgi:hypothetical protein
MIGSKHPCDIILIIACIWICMCFIVNTCVLTILKMKRKNIENVILSSKYDLLIYKSKANIRSSIIMMIIFLIIKLIVWRVS